MAGDTVVAADATITSMASVDHGLGALQSPPDERDFPIAQLFAEKGLAAAAVFPPSFYVPNRAPVSNQGNSPECVAFCCKGLTNTHEMAEKGHFVNLDQDRFFRQIGGTANGAFMRVAMSRMLTTGFPVVDDAQPPLRIKAYYRVPPFVNDVKAALMAFGELAWIGPWYDSWRRPYASSISGWTLPRPNYQIGGHAIRIIGWNPGGARLRNSWGTSWGGKGDVTMPWAYVWAGWEIWKTVDALDT